MDDLKSPRARRLLGKLATFRQELDLLLMQPPKRSAQSRIRDINVQIGKLERRLRSEAAKQLSVAFSLAAPSKTRPRL